jgi:polyhydroxybutyrate depolymerase
VSRRRFLWPRPLLLAGVVAALLLVRHAALADHRGATTSQAVRVAGIQRTYLLHVGATVRPQQPTPLLLSFHGGGGQGAGQERFSGFDEVADRSGLIVAYPDGINRHWEDSRKEAQSGHHDLEFVHALIEQVASRWVIDRSRIYATGISNGGFFSLRLACELADQIAAVAAVAAALPDQGRACAPSRPVSVLLLNGTEDPLVPYQGGTVGGSLHLGLGGHVLSSAATVAAWARFDRCSPPGITTKLPVVDGQDATQVERLDYPACAGGSEVALYTIQGGGHTWPGGSQYLPQRWIGRTTRQINATAVIADFFSRHRLTPP